MSICLERAGEHNLDQAFLTYQEFPKRESQFNRHMSDLGRSREVFEKFVRLLAPFSTLPCVGVFLVTVANRSVGSIVLSPLVSDGGRVEVGIFMRKDMPGFADRAMAQLYDEIVQPNLGKTFKFWSGTKTEGRVVERVFCGIELKVQPDNDASLAHCARRVCVVSSHETENDGKNSIVFHIPPPEVPPCQYKEIQGLINALPTTRRGTDERHRLIERICKAWWRLQ